MGLETTASLSTIAGFNVDWPLSTDPFSECDDQINNLKLGTYRTFPNIGSEMSANAAELNYLTGSPTTYSGQCTNSSNVGLIDGGVGNWVTFGLEVGDTVTNLDTSASVTIAGFAGLNLVAQFERPTTFAQSANYRINYKNDGVKSAVQGQIDAKLGLSVTAVAMDVFGSSARFISSATPSTSVEGSIWFKIGS